MRKISLRFWVIFTLSIWLSELNVTDLSSTHNRAKPNQTHNLKQNYPAKLILEQLTPSQLVNLCEINVSCCMLLRFQVVCYIAIGNDAQLTVCGYFYIFYTQLFIGLLLPPQNHCVVNYFSEISLNQLLKVKYY